MTRTTHWRGRIDDLRSLHGGKLPAGTYRYIAARGVTPAGKNSSSDRTARCPGCSVIPWPEISEAVVIKSAIEDLV
jgi:hypothetical protein